MTGFAPQCCDAVDYLELGRRCAAAGECYDELRPVGAALWFAWPQALGLPAETLLVAHAALAVASTLLAARTAWRRLKDDRPAAPALPGWMAPLLLIGSGALHLFTLLPTARNSLADPPAALAFAIACWLLLDPRRRGVATAVAGLALGAAVSIRAFYLYPALVLLAAVLALALLRRPRRWRESLLLLALLPVAVQVGLVWRHAGSMSFIDPVQRAKWSTFHLADGAAGYDTLLPLEPFRWPANCAPGEPGFTLALATRDAGLVACLLGARLHFYFGSHAAHTYLAPADGDLDRFAEAEVVDSRMSGLLMRFNAARAPDGRDTAISMTRAPGSAIDDVPGVERYFIADRTQPYTYTVWAWSASTRELEVRLWDVADDKLLAEQRFALGTAPTRHALTMALQAGRKYRLFVGGPQDAAPGWGEGADGAVLVWDGRLVAGDAPTEPAATDRGEHRRWWSNSLFAIQLTLGALSLMAVARRGLGGDAAALGVAAGVLAMLGQSLVIVPEQRFVIVPQLLLWFGGCGALLGAWQRGRGEAATMPASGSGGRFLLFGAVNTGVTALLYWLLASPLGAQAAYVSAYIAGIGLAYAGNTAWVFRSAPRWSTALPYPLLYVAQYLVGAGLLAWLTGPAGVDPRLALLPVLAVTVPLSYALNRMLLRPRGLPR